MVFFEAFELFVAFLICVTMITQVIVPIILDESWFPVFRISERRRLARKLKEEQHRREVLRIKSNLAIESKVNDILEGKD